MCVLPSASDSSSFASRLSAGTEGWGGADARAASNAGGGPASLAFDPVDEQGS